MATTMLLIQPVNSRRARVNRAAEGAAQKPDETPTPDVPTSETCRLAETNAAATRNGGSSSAFVHVVDDNKSVCAPVGDLPDQWTIE